MTDFVPCPCGSIRPPKPVVERGARKLALIRLRCPKCGLTSTAARAGRVPQAWNAAVERDIVQRLKELGE
jgi:hypothetical protein